MKPAEVSEVGCGGAQMASLSNLHLHISAEGKNPIMRQRAVALVGVLNPPLPPRDLECW